MSPTTEPSDHQGHAATEHVSPQPSTNSGGTQEQTSFPVISSLNDVISIIGPHAGEREAYRTLHLDAEELRNAKQDEIRKLCKPWGVTLNAKNAQGKWIKRSDPDLKRDIQEKMIERARKLQRRLGTATHYTVTSMQERCFLLNLAWDRVC